MTASGKMAIKIALPKLSPEEDKTIKENNKLKMNGNKVGNASTINNSNSNTTQETDQERKDENIEGGLEEAKTSFIEKSSEDIKQSNLETVSWEEGRSSSKLDSNGTLQDKVLINNTNMVTL